MLKSSKQQIHSARTDLMEIIVMEKFTPATFTEDFVFIYHTS